jgi:hypothetical protein
MSFGSAANAPLLANLGGRLIGRGHRLNDSNDERFHNITCFQLIGKDHDDHPNFKAPLPVALSRFVLRRRYTAPSGFGHRRFGRLAMHAEQRNLAAADVA